MLWYDNPLESSLNIIIRTFVLTTCFKGGVVLTITPVCVGWALVAHVQIGSRDLKEWRTVRAS